jgi:hypothetical protein
MCIKELLIEVNKQNRVLVFFGHIILNVAHDFLEHICSTHSGTNKEAKVIHMTMITLLIKAMHCCCSSTFFILIKIFNYV